MKAQHPQEPQQAQQPAQAQRPEQPQQPHQPKPPQQVRQPGQPQSVQQRTVMKAVIDLQDGDALVGRNGGLSVIEDSSDHSGHLGLMRVETEHGHLYLELDAEVKVVAPQITDNKK